MRPSVLWTGAAAVVGATLVLAAVWPQSSGDGPRGRTQADAWLDASPPPVARASDVEAVVRSKIWAGEPPPAAPATTQTESAPARWWLMAVYGDGPTRAVIVGQTGKSDVTLRPGDALPSGDKIVDITAQGVCVLLNGQRRLLPLNDAPPMVW